KKCFFMAYLSLPDSQRKAQSDRLHALGRDNQLRFFSVARHLVVVTAGGGVYTKHHFLILLPLGMWCVIRWSAGAIPQSIYSSYSTKKMRIGKAHGFLAPPGRAPSPLRRGCRSGPAARCRAAQRASGWCWTGAAAWGRVGPSRVPWGPGSGRA